VTRTMLKLAALSAAMPLASCVTVKPPDKPIEINLNVAIRQEVLVRLQQDVQQMINKNRGPQAGARDQHPSPQPLSRACRPPERDRAGGRGGDRLPALPAAQSRRGLPPVRQCLASLGSGPAQASAGAVRLTG
jgi:hypothetical protein